MEPEVQKAANARANAAGERLVQEETTMVGGVAARVYYFYFRHMASPPMVLFLLLLYAVTQPFKAAGDEYFGLFATGKDISVRRFLALYIGFMVRCARNGVWGGGRGPATFCSGVPLPCRAREPHRRCHGLLSNTTVC